MLALLPCAAFSANAQGSRSTAVFTDVTASSGIDYFQHQLVGNTVDLGEPAFMSGGAAAGDYDGDGYADLYVTRFDAPDILYRNKGDGTFEDVTVLAGIERGNGSNGAAWGDIDNDGDLDLYVTAVDTEGFFLFVNDGFGHFTEEAVPRGAAVDGEIPYTGFSVAFGDYDQDGYLDIHTTEWGKAPFAVSNARLLRNRGLEKPGFFEDVTALAGVTLGLAPGTYGFTSRFSDLDRDGLPDLAVASDFGTSQLFWNNGDGTFTEGTVAAGVGSDENGMGSAIGDFDGDGLLDWFVSSIFDPEDTCSFLPCGWGNSGNRLYRNNGDRSFTDATDAAGVRDGGWGWGAAFIDYDNDGDLDLIHTNGVEFPGSDVDQAYNADATRFWENDGKGRFAEVAASVGITDTASGKGLLKFDYDRDGDLDLFIVNNGAKPVLYRNDGGNALDWLRVVTFGKQPAVGAWIAVEAKPGGKTQVRELHASSNFLAQDEAGAHFGLGRGKRPVDRVTITWPGGDVTRYDDVPRNAILAIGHGSGGGTYFGAPGQDYAIGGAGADLIVGWDGDDVLAGGGGGDILGGALGSDRIAGGPGADHFYLRPGDGGASSEGADVITDFSPGIDRLVFLAVLSGDLIVTEVDGSAAVQVLSSGEFLVLLPGIDVLQLNPAEFIFL